MTTPLLSGGKIVLMITVLKILKNLISLYSRGTVIGTRRVLIQF